MFAEVALSISTFQTFTYKIPKNLADNAQIGIRVKIKFGNRFVYGVIISLSNKVDYNGTIKNISEIVDEKPIISDTLWKLINWISYYYITPIGKVFNTILPVQLSSNYSVPLYWYVKYNSSINQNDRIILKNKFPKQYNLLNHIKLKAPKYVSVSSLKELSKSPLSSCKSLYKKNFVSLVKKEKDFNFKDYSFDLINKNIIFNSDQKSILEKLKKPGSFNKFNPFLLHGVTGSGKTEIFIDLIKEVLKQGKTGIILLPEISLTPQIAGRFMSVFGDSVVLWHSQLTNAQRQSIWVNIFNGKHKVVIGARSAVFTPLKNVGLIVVDEEHESAYKQHSPSPMYHGRDVAIMRSKLESSMIVLSSATPSLESYFNYKNNKYKYLELSKRYGGAKQPKVTIVDLVDEREKSNKSDIVISNTLFNKIEDRLKKNEQILIIQNRRGYSPSVRCNDCSEIIMCKSCNTSLTFHENTGSLKCHLCGFKDMNVENCKSCLGSNLFYIGTGTQKVEKLLKRTFNNASIARIDQDSIKQKSKMTKILKAFSNKNIDILLGTQMIAKGLDFPDITLVGIINADLGLHFPDFRSSEKTFQLIYQAAGRAGRAKKNGEVIIQTYDKNNPIIKAISNFDLNNYYKIMLDDRKLLKYPPYSRIIKIEFIGTNINSVISFSNNIKNNFSKYYKGLQILGPASCFLEKIKNNYRFQIILKSSKKYDPNGKKLHSFISHNFFNKKNVQYRSNKIKIHVDPINMI